MATNELTTLKTSELIAFSRARGATEIHLEPGLPLRLRVRGKLENVLPHSLLTEAQVDSLIEQTKPYGFNSADDLDQSYPHEEGKQRYRFHVYHTGTKLAVIIRHLN